MSGTGAGLGRIDVPHWYANLVADAVEHALAEADWQEHGTPTLASWLLAELERLATNLGGAAASPNLLARIKPSRENTDKLAIAFRSGLQRDAELHERRRSVGDSWFVERTVDMLGLRFEATENLPVPRAVFQLIEAAVHDTFTHREDVHARLLAALEPANLPDLLARAQAMIAKPPTLAALLGENLPLAAILAVELTTDPEAEARALDALANQAPRAYKPSEKYAVGESIDHAKLGRGVVVSLGEGKIRVRFADGERTLVHART